MKSVVAPLVRTSGAEQRHGPRAAPLTDAGDDLCQSRLDDS